MGWFDSAMSGTKDFLFGTSGDAISDAAGRQGKYDTEYEGKVNAALAPYSEMADTGAAKSAMGAYVGGLQGLDTDQYKTTAATLDTGNVLGDVGSFLDPSIKYQQEAAQKAVESSQAGKGGLFSGAAGQSISNATQKIAEQGWGGAYTRANQAQQQANQAKLQQQQAAQSAGTYNLGMDTTGINAQGQAYNTLMEPISTVAQTQMDTAGTMYGSRSGMNQQQMQGQMADTGYFGDILSFGSKLL